MASRWGKTGCQQKATSGPFDFAFSSQQKISVIVLFYFVLGQMSHHNGAGLKNQRAQTTQEMIPSHVYTWTDQHEKSKPDTHVMFSLNHQNRIIEHRLLRHVPI